MQAKNTTSILAADTVGKKRERIEERKRKRGKPHMLG